MVTPGPKTTKGPTTVSRPILVSALKNTVSGATSVTPAAIASPRSRRCIDALADGDAGPEDDEGAHHGVAADPRVGAEEHGLGCHERHARRHRLTAQPAL